MITTLDITGMTCNGCVKHVDRALREIPGVTAVQVSLPDHHATVEHDPDAAPLPALIAAVSAAGYDATAGDLAKV